MRQKVLPRSLTAALVALAVIAATLLMVKWAAMPAFATDGAAQAEPVAAASDQGDLSSDATDQQASDATDQQAPQGEAQQSADEAADAGVQAEAPGQDDAAAESNPADVIESADETPASDAQDSAAADMQAPAASESDDGETSALSADVDKSAAADILAATPVLAAMPASLTPTAVLYVDGDAGDDASSGADLNSAMKTLDAALKQAPVVGANQIRIRGNFIQAQAITIPAGISLVVESDAYVVPGGANNGIILEDGATLACENGAALTMSGFTGSALTVKAGASVGDGNYALDGNSIGLNLAGVLQGSSKDALHVSAQGCAGQAIWFASGSKMINCTVDVESTTNGGDIETGIHLENADLSTKGVWYYFKDEFSLLAGSTFTVQAAIDPAYRQAMTIDVAGTISGGSTLAVSGSRVSVAKDLSITGDSTLNISNSSRGGLNINGGNVTVEDSNLLFSGMTALPAYGVDNGSLSIEGNSSVITPANNSSVDNGGARNGKYYVSGGTFDIAYDGSNPTVTTPSNGAWDGAERLHLFTLADPSVTTLEVVTLGGDTYGYDVTKANPDGSKRVWVPAATLAFELNDPQAADQVHATFADGTTAAKTALAMRGYALSAASNVVSDSVEIPADPIAAGYRFEGWVLADGTPFSPDTKISADTTVYAKWSADAASYVVNYHVNYGDADAVYTTSLNSPDRMATVASIDQAAAGNAAFTLAGRNFTGWNSAADGSGTAYVAGDTLTVPEDKTGIDLYAQWDYESATVRFSANGGAFADTSVFKTRTDLFDVSLDANGGEVATLKATARKVDKKSLNDLVQSIDPNTTVYQLNLSSTTKLDHPEELAVRSHYDLAYDEVPFFFFKSYYYWFTDGTGTTHTSVATSSPITSDVTYYLKWNLNPAVQHDAGNLQVFSDLYGSAADTSSSPDFVRQSQEFSLTNAVELDALKARMADIEQKYTVTPDQFDSIAISNTDFTITTALKLASGIDASGATVSIDGLNGEFTTSSSVAGDIVTVTFKLAGNANGFTTYAELHAAIESLPASMNITVSGLKLADGGLTDGQKLVSVGEVNGALTTIAERNGVVRKFDYKLTGTQSDAGRDVDAPDANVVQFTDVVVLPVQTNMSADMLVNSDSETVVPYEVYPGDQVTITGAIDTTSILAQMEAIEAQYPGHAFTDIAVKVNDATFTATIQLPASMPLPTNVALTHDGFGDAFEIVDQQVDGATNTLTVFMKLKDGITNYQQLKDAAQSAGIDDGKGHKFMYVTLSGVTPNPAEIVLTAIGTVNGHFDAIATVPSGTRHDFVFDWVGKQIPELKDAVTPAGDDTISVSMLIPSTDMQALPGDMLVEGDTQHTDTIKVKPGQATSLTGAVDVSIIKDQMAAIEAKYPVANYDDIAVDVNDFAFEADLKLADGLTVDQALAVDDVVGSQLGGFVVKSVSVNGQDVRVEFALASPVANYTQLKALVDPAGGADGWMSVTVPVQVAADAADGATLTSYGYVYGSLAATAQVASGERHVFLFNWNAEQWADGADSTAKPGDDTISLTMQVNNPEQPGSSENDKPGSSSNDKPGSSSNDKPGSSSNDKPGSSSNDKPGSSSNDKPGSSSNDKPGSSSNDKPGSSADEKPAPHKPSDSASSSADKDSASSNKESSSFDKKRNDIPRTGDATDLGGTLAAGLTGIAVLGAGAVLAARRRNEN